MILYLNGSPRLEGSNSNFFLNKVKDKGNIRYLYRDKFDNILKDIKDIDTIVFSFPLYVDGPPSGVIKFMEYIRDKEIDISNKNIYTIINCGFWEAKHNRMADMIMQCFANSNKANYKGSLLIGAGEIIGKCNKVWLYKFVSIPFLFKIKRFKNCIDNGDSTRMETTIRPMWKRLYVFMANINWKRQMIRNNCYK